MSNFQNWTTVEQKKKKKPMGNYGRPVMVEEKKSSIVNLVNKQKGISKLTPLAVPIINPNEIKVAPPKLNLTVCKPSTENSTSEIHRLNDTWELWFYDMAKMKDAKWSAGGNEKIMSFNTVEDFWILYNNLTDLTNGMYYLMRAGYPPIWDDPANANGGGWTFKIDKRNLSGFWKDLSCYCVGESLCAQSENVVGLSISPKVRNVTVRVWTKNTEQTPELYDKLAKDTEHSSISINFRKDARFMSNAEALKQSEKVYGNK